MTTEEEVENTTAEMEKMMGFSAFHSTQGEQVPGNEHNYGVAVPQTPMREDATGSGGVAVPKPGETAENNQNRPLEQVDGEWTVETATKELKRVLRVGEQEVGGDEQSQG